MSTTIAKSEEEKKKIRAEQSRLSRLRKKQRIAASMTTEDAISDKVGNPHKDGIFISITARGIVERGLWSAFEQYVIFNSTPEEREHMVRENVTIEISENDAYLIGLLKVLYTDNVCHMFNLYINRIMVNKGFIEKSGKNLIHREVLLMGIDRFHKTFPAYYEPDTVWSEELRKSFAYAEELKEGILTLRKHEDHMLVQDQVCVALASVKKLLRHNH